MSRTGFDQIAAVKLLIERFRHRPRFLTVPQTVQVIRRLIRNALADPGGCIYWAGAVNNKHYGRINVRLHGRHFQFFVHRLAFQLAHDPGDIPKWMEVHHDCCRPPCFHPAHLAKIRRTVNRRLSAENTNAKRWGAARTMDGAVP
jgi:hypothetical protein